MKFNLDCLKRQFQMRDCFRGLSKGCLMGINALFILISILTVGIYIVDANIVQKYGEAHVKETIVADVFMVVTGAFLIAISCLGCLGAARESYKYLSLYMGLVIMLMVMELMLGILVSVLRYGLEFSITSWMRNDFFRNVTEGEVEQHQKIWQQIQSEYECCGLNGPQDYNAIFKRIDISCCKYAFNAVTEAARNKLHNYCVITDDYYKLGCEKQVLYDLKESNDFLFSIAVLCFSAETVAVLLAILLTNNLKNEVKVYKQTVRY